MDSINAQQPEENFNNLEGEAAWEKVKEMAESAESCFLCSNIKTGLPFSARPMAILKADNDGTLWFMSAGDSHKNTEINQDPFVQVLCQGSKHADFLSVYGIADIITDKDTIEELWTPLAKTWFTGGKDDPRITVIKLSITQGHYWDNKHGNAVAFIKTVAGAMLGQTYDDSVEGDLGA